MFREVAFFQLRVLGGVENGCSHEIGRAVRYAIFRGIASLRSSKYVSGIDLSPSCTSLIWGYVIIPLPLTTSF